MAHKRFLRSWAAVLALAALLLAACSRDDGPGPDGGERVPVSFTASMDGAALPSAKTAGTRTTTGGDEWVQDDAVGIFMLTPDGYLTTPADVLANNVEYTATPGSSASDASFAPADAAETISYPPSGNVDFVAYYPYGDMGTDGGEITADYKYTVVVTYQGNPAALGVLYAKASNVPWGTTPVALTFEHKMSRVTLNVKAGVDFTSDDIQNIPRTEVEIGNIPRSAALDLRDGTLEPGTLSYFNIFKEATPLDGADATFSAILVPQPDGGKDRTVTFNVGGNDYVWNIPDGDIFAAGNHYTYSVTIGKSGITVGKPTIEDWGENDNGTTPAEPLPAGTVKIYAGTFTMGSPRNEIGRDYYNETQHQVTLTKDFYMSRYEVTKAQFTDFLNAVGVEGVTIVKGTEPLAWHEVSGYGEQIIFSVNEYGWTPVWDTRVSKWVSQSDQTLEQHPDDAPMIDVTWYGAKAYADWVGGRLPTEAEWEYACRAGTTYAYSFGDERFGDNLWDFDIFDDHVWYVGNTSEGPGIVGTKKANMWGLYDMHGNVMEWCSDWYDVNYGSANAGDAATDPTGPDTGTNRVSRGGNWDLDPDECRSAYRYRYLLPNSPSAGIRVVFDQ